MKVLYKNCTMFDGLHDEMQKNAQFVVDEESGKFTAVGDDAVKADKEVDLGGKYVMPGMIDAHTHMMMNAETNKLYFLSETEVTVQALANLKEGLQAGLTSIRDCGCAFNVDIKLNKLRKAHPFIGPKIMPSGRPMSITGGHGDFAEGEDGQTPWGHLVDSQDQMRHAVRENFKEGAENIKMMATGGVMSATDQVDDVELSLPEMKTAVEEAHSKHMTCCAHAEGRRGIHDAILAGVDSVEHGNHLAHEDVQLMKDKGIFLTPTLIAGYTIQNYGQGKLPDYMLKKCDQEMKVFFANVGYAIKQGVKLAFGTDSGTPFNPFKLAPLELELMTQAGATNFQALRAATMGSATLMHKDKEVGSIEKGKAADFLVLDEDPLANIKAVQQEHKGVYQNGKKMF